MRRENTKRKEDVVLRVGSLNFFAFSLCLFLSVVSSTVCLFGGFVTCVFLFPEANSPLPPFHTSIPQLGGSLLAKILTLSKLVLLLLRVIGIHLFDFISFVLDGLDWTGLEALDHD